MKCHKSNDNWVIVLAKGEKVIEKLTEFCKKENILSGCFNAIGAINQVEMAHFDPVKKHYSYKQMTGALEIVSLMGNITRKDGEVVIHSHINVSAEDMLCYGGHLKEAIVAVTCEITLTNLKTKITRAFDNEIGLNLIQ
ncbi:MAG: PPC domain-containing DNA-binding protein [Planctomycetota bacterium]